MTGSRESRLRITVSRAGPPSDAGRTVVLTVRGSLDIDSAVRLHTTLGGVLDISASRIVVDLSGLEFCDSIGLSALADGYRACQQRGGFLRLAAPNQFLMRVLDVVGLAGQLAIYDSVAAAMADEPPGGRPPPAGDRFRR